MGKFILILGIVFCLFILSAKCQEKCVATELAELAIKTKSESITPNAYKAAKKALIDVMGVAMAAYDKPGVKEVEAQMTDWAGKEEATIWFYGNKLPSPNAIFVNSVLVHTLDLDDCHVLSANHITSIVVPVSLAIGELANSSGEEVLDAIILGIEVAARIGKEYVKHKELEQSGFLPTSVVGGLGAVAASARLLKLSVEQTANAFGIFYAQASGNRQALYEYTLTKRLQPAFAAKAGTLATFLAKKGISGPKDIFLSENGLFNLYGAGKGEPPTAADLIRKEEYFEIEKVSYKKYACCGASHAAIEAAIELSEEFNLKLEDVKTIEVGGVGPGGFVGIDWNDDEDPHVLSQFCAPYEIAAAIKYHRFGPSEVDPENIKSNPDIIEASKKVQMKDIGYFDIKNKTKWTQVVRISLNNGKVYQKALSLADVYRDPNSVSYEGVIKKFRYNTGFSKVPVDTEKMLERIESMDKIDNINSFINEFLR